MSLADAKIKRMPPYRTLPLSAICQSLPPIPANVANLSCIEYCVRRIVKCNLKKQSQFYAQKCLKRANEKKQISDKRHK